MDFHFYKDGWNLDFQTMFELDHKIIYNIKIKGKDLKGNNKKFNSWESFENRKYVSEEVKEYFKDCFEKSKEKAKVQYLKEQAAKQRKIDQSMKDFKPVWEMFSKRFELGFDECLGDIIYDKELGVNFILDDFLDKDN